MELTEECGNLMATINDIVFELDVNYTFLNVWTVNNGMLFVNKDVLINKTIDECFDAQLASKFKTAIKWAIEKKDKITVDYQSPYPGDNRWFTASVFTTIGVNSQKQVIVFVNDITKSRQAEEFLHMQRDLSLALSSCSMVDEALAYIIDTVLKIENIDSGAIYLVDPQTGILNLRVHRGAPAWLVEAISTYEADGPQAQIARSGKPYYSEYRGLPAFINRMQEQENEGIKFFGRIPVIYEDQFIAMLSVASHKEGEFTDAMKDMLETIAMKIGSTLTRIFSETALRESRENLQALFNSINDFLFVLDMNGCIQQINKVVEKRLGYQEEELLGMSVVHVHPSAQKEQVMSVMTEILQGESDVCTIPLQTKRGSLIPVETRVTHGVWNSQPVLFGISRDISKRVKAEIALQGSKERLELALLGGDLAVWDWNYQTGVILLSDRLYQMIGYYEEEFFRYIGSLYKLIHPADLPGMQAALNKHIQGRAFFYEAEYRIRHKLGDWIYTLARGKIIEWDTQGKPLRLCGINIDISKRKKLEAELQALAMTDVLTGIYNRRYFTQLLEKEMKRSQRYQTSFSLVMFDIDHFKQVNDTYGHDVGDLVLKEVVSLIKTRIRKTDFFARWGGEEFIILLLNTSYEQAAILAESMRELLQNTSLPQVGRVTASFGVSSYQANESIDALLKRVDDLVYQAKRNGRNCVRVDRY